MLWNCSAYLTASRVLTALTPFRVEEADFDAGRVVLSFSAQPAFANHFGNVQGGFAVAMIDVLVSVAALAMTKTWLPTLEMKSSFVSPVKMGICRGEGAVVKAGQQIFFLEAKLWGPDGKRGVHAAATAAVPRLSVFFPWLRLASLKVTAVGTVLDGQDGWHRSVFESPA